MSKNFNLDAAKAARAEVDKTNPSITFGGKDFALPTEIPFAIAEASTGEVGDLHKAVKSLLGNQYETWAELNPSLQDIGALFDALPGLYGIDLPN